ncbi:precorrin-6y C5,15-methyltransferase (decarboxylating) subunit CbiE [Fusobacterium sp.]|uniref:precorrin-6y C5,15-methyltransferase (decarboxylating) subunit CbiE n=1 Tax=Fusobacterium sp. TaxID=68766 RepID=UPI0039BF0406
MNKICVVGLGPGNLDFLTGAGRKAIETCEVVIGGSRQLEELDELISKDCEKYILGKLSEVVDFIRSREGKDITVVVSGDTGFYSLLPFLKRNFRDEELKVIPGISSYQYLFSRIGECWQNYTLASVHGRDFDYIEGLKNGIGVVLLTDEKNTPYNIAKNIYQSGIEDIEIVIGERLSYPDEKITKLDVNEYEKLNREFKMNIVILRKRA